MKLFMLLMSMISMMSQTPSTKNNDMTMFIDGRIYKVENVYYVENTKHQYIQTYYIDVDGVEYIIEKHDGYDVIIKN